MERTSVNNFLGNQIEKMIPLTLKELPVIKIMIQHTQKQEETLCGFFACAFATALCNHVAVENLIFDTDRLTAHWLDCIKTQRATMFPSLLRKKTSKTDHLIIQYNRIESFKDDTIPKKIKCNIYYYKYRKTSHRVTWYITGLPNGRSLRAAH